jgi:hypothetical protein
LHGGAGIVKERGAVIDEVADGQIAKQELPAAHEVEEVIVGEERRAAVGIVEPQQPGEAEERDSGCRRNQQPPGAINHHRGRGNTLRCHRHHPEFWAAACATSRRPARLSK